MDALILHIETSSLACSVALSRGDTLIGTQTLLEKYVHSSALAPLVRDVLATAGHGLRDLQAIAVSIGPGSYTGLRVGLSFAKGLCTILKCPLIAVDTLESLAWTAMGADEDKADYYVSALDARRSDAYIAAFASDRSRITEDRFISVGPEVLDEWLGDGSGVVVFGEGIEKWACYAGHSGVETRMLGCDARNLVQSAVQAFENQVFADPATCVPAYLKAPNITISR